jgi:hypothetical protein
LDALIEVFDGENHARAASEGLNFGSSVLKLGNKALDLWKLGHHIKVAVWVYSAIKGTSERLERMNMRLNRVSWQREAISQCRGLSLNRFDCWVDDVFLNLILYDHYLGLAWLYLLYEYLSLHHHQLLISYHASLSFFDRIVTRSSRGILCLNLGIICLHLLQVTGRR